MSKRKFDRKTLKYYARMAAEAYVNDPVHSYATKNEKIRKKYIYHFMMERLSTSNREDIIYEDEEKRGICVWRDAHNEYNMFDFLLCPNWVFLCVYLPNTIKTLSAYSHLDVKVFPENTKIISPVFTDVAHQGKGIASALIKQGIKDLTAKGYKLGLEAQREDNVKFYEKLGFKVIRHDYYEKEKLHSYYMMYEENAE
ncbi:MAG: GNAT family N-acetyltransferase [Clostridia bacterium]|nr:GNAT family N-acetyltransferase [Clostridia bacterium]